MAQTTKSSNSNMNMFSLLSDDIVLQIFHKLEDDPRHWSRLACVSTRFSALIRLSCFKSTCIRTLPSDLLADLPSSSSSAASWSSLHKLSVCCPGPLHAGLFLDTSDFGLLRELGPDLPLSTAANAQPPSASHQSNTSADCWSLYDDLYYDTVYDPSEQMESGSEPQQTQTEIEIETETETETLDSSWSWKMKGCRSSHVAGGSRRLSRDQGRKLLGREFREDRLYLCEWPGCVHAEEKRSYRLFRGLFKNFKRTRVWRTINDGHRNTIPLACAFCFSHHTWDLHSAFCLRRAFGYHDDGEPVVRAFVCENGHVSGAWTDLPPIYT